MPFIPYRHLMRTGIEHIRFNCNTTDRTIVNPARIVDMNLTFIPAKRHTSHQVAIPNITVNNCSALLRIDKPSPEHQKFLCGCALMFILYKCSSV